MRSINRTLFLLCFALLLVCAKNVARAQDAPPDNIAGNWNLYTKGDDGKTGSHTLKIEQNGHELSGHFKGPYQSGGLEGSVNGHQVLIRTKTRNVLVFRGMIQGNEMKGRFEFHGREARAGDWSAVRAN